MKRRYIGLAMGGLLAVASALSLPSCGHDQKLVSLQIQPQVFTFLTADADQTEQLTALATYIHPPAQKDVTTQATWAVDDGIVSVSKGLVTTPGGTCGGADVTATMPEGTGGSENIITSTSTVTVDDPSNPLCPGGGKLAQLAVAVTGSGSVASVPPQISCPSVCVAVYDIGASVLLQATPTNGTSVTWLSGCSAQSGNECTVTIADGGSAVLAQFE